MRATGVDIAPQPPMTKYRLRILADQKQGSEGFTQGAPGYPNIDSQNDTHDELTVFRNAQGKFFFTKISL